MRKGLPAAATVFLVLASVCSVGKDSTGSKPVFPDVTARGRALYEYDQAARHALDAVRAVQPTPGVVKLYIARKSDTGWTVVFGRLSDQGHRFLISYKASEAARTPGSRRPVSGNAPQEFVVSKIDPPAEDASFYLAAAKAIGLALHDFKGETRAYSGAVLPAPSDQFYVYIYPSQTGDGVYPMGGDVRYLISADGSTIADEHRMHKSILEVESKPPNSYWIGNYHTHEQSDEPEDSDVFHALSSKMPEYIGVPNKKFYRVNTDGTIVEVKKGRFVSASD